MSGHNSNCFVYVYFDANGHVRYVGKGSTARATVHLEASQNPAFSAWLQSEKHTIRHAGPYCSEQEALVVEAALISILKSTNQPLFNKSLGKGPKFQPLGVPVEKSDRFVEEPLTKEEIGKITGGAMIVLVNSYDMTNPDTDSVRNAIQHSWQVNQYMDSWMKHKDIAPKAIIGIGGSKTRLIVGAFIIDVDRLGHPSDLGKKWKLWSIPVLKESDPDALSMQGRRVKDIRFGRSRNEHYFWIGSDGEVLHPKKPHK